jgi:uncharacterized membrane protein
MGILALLQSEWTNILYRIIAIIVLFLLVVFITVGAAYCLFGENRRKQDTELFDEYSKAMEDQILPLIKKKHLYAK